MFLKSLAAAALLAVASSIAPPGDDLSFHPASSTTLARTFESRQEFSEDEAEMLLNGQPFPAGKGGMNGSQARRLELRDELASVEGGKPRKLRRTFDKLESSGEQTVQHPMDAGEESDTRHAKSELEGKTVVFEWNAAKERFDKRFDPEGPEEQLLAGLVEDVDFRQLLPAKGTAAADDTWRVDLAAIPALFLPGGDLAFRAVDAPEGEAEGGLPSMFQGDTPAEAFSGLTGEIEATYKGAREVDGVQCGTIGIAFKAGSHRDVGDKLAKRDAPGSEIHTKRVEVILDLEGEGELLWDLSGGCARSFTSSAKIKVQVNIDMTLDSGGKSMDLTRKLALSGSYDLQVAVHKL